MGRVGQSSSRCRHNKPHCSRPLEEDAHVTLVVLCCELWNSQAEIWQYQSLCHKRCGRSLYTVSSCTVFLQWESPCNCSTYTRGCTSRLRMSAEGYCLIPKTLVLLHHCLIGTLQYLAYRSTEHYTIQVL